MEYHDKVLKCSECGAEFVFTAGEQMFFADKGFKNEPKRCKGCKAKRAEGSGGGGGTATPMRAETKTNCSQCGRKPRCRFARRRGARSSAANVSSSAAPWALPSRKGTC